MLFKTKKQIFKKDLKNNTNFFKKIKKKRKQNTPLKKHFFEKHFLNIMLYITYNKNKNVYKTFLIKIMSLNES